MPRRWFGKRKVTAGRSPASHQAAEPKAYFSDSSGGVCLLMPPGIPWFDFPVTRLPQD